MHVVLIRSYTDKAWRSPQTYDAIESSLRKRWSVSVIHTTDVETLKKELQKYQKQYGQQIFVFNIAEYLDEDHKIGFLPAILDELGIPHLGSSATSNRAGLDKAAAKELFMKHEVPTPSFFVAEEKADITKEAVEAIGFPLIVKPLHEGGHIGIDERSIVRDIQHLEKAVERILDEYEQPALIEDYIVAEGMREFSVGVIEGEPSLFTPIEIDFDAMDTDQQILSFDLAQNDLEEICLVEEEGVRLRINQLAADAFDAVGAEDYSRVDIRMNATGYYVLEINTMPGLGPHSFLPQAVDQIYDLDFTGLIEHLTEHALQRQNPPVKTNKNLLV